MCWTRVKDIYLFKNRIGGVIEGGGGVEELNKITATAKDVASNK